MVLHLKLTLVHSRPISLCVWLGRCWLCQAGTEPMSRAIEQLMDQCVAKSYSPTIAGNDNMTLLLISFDNIDSGCFSCLRPRRRTVVPDR